MNDKEDIQKILNKLIEEISTVNPDQKVGTIVKSIDKLVFSCYSDLYKTIDVKKEIKNNKHGHCC